MNVNIGRMFNTYTWCMLDLYVGDICWMYTIQWRIVCFSKIKQLLASTKYTENCQHFMLNVYVGCTLSIFAGCITFIIYIETYIGCRWYMYTLEVYWMYMLDVSWANTLDKYTVCIHWTFTLSIYTWRICWRLTLERQGDKFMSWYSSYEESTILQVQILPRYIKKEDIISYVLVQNMLPDVVVLILCHESDQFQNICNYFVMEAKTTIMFH